MTVKELMQTLRDFPGDMQIVLSKDSEGNSCSPLEEVTGGVYRENSYAGYGGYFQNEEVDEDEINAICFWPVN